MSRDGAPSVEPSKQDKFVSKIESARISQERVDAEQFTTQFDARMDGVEVTEFTEAIKKIDAELEKIAPDDVEGYQRLEDLKELFSNLRKMKQAPSLKGAIVDKMAKFQIFDINRLAKMSGISPKIGTVLEGLSNAVYHIAQSRFPDRFKAQRTEEDARNEEDLKETKERIMNMKVS